MSALDDMNTIRLINLLQRSMASLLSSTNKLPLRETVVNTCTEYLDHIKTRRGINDYSINECSEIVGWKMNKWGDLTFIHEFTVDEILVTKNISDKITKGKRQRPRRLLRRYAKRKVGRCELSYSVYPTTPLAYVTINSVISNDNVEHRGLE